MTERKSRSVRRGLILASGSSGFIALITWRMHGLRDALLMLAILAPVGVLTVASVTLLLSHRARLGGLRPQLAVLGTIAVGQLLVAVGLLLELMFVSSDAALLTGLAAINAGLLGAWAARSLAQRMLDDVDQVREGLSAVGAGLREMRIDVSGNDELARLAGDVEQMVGHLAEEERARTAAQSAHHDLLAAVSHDLRTPITSLRLLAAALQDEMVDESTRRDYVARIGTNVRALSALIDDLFELSRLQAGDIRWAMSGIEVGELVRETVEAMRPHAEARSLAMNAELGVDVHVPRANPEQIQRVLFNLIQNAIRHTPADGSITVRAHPTAGAVEIEVADTGSGIPTEDRERVFAAFVQGSEHAARSGTNAGLGLAISRAIVEAHGGRIWLADTAIGTRVRFSLPRTGAMPA